MEQMKKFFFDIGWVLASTVINMGVGFLLRTMLARWLGATDLGLYTMVITIQEIAALVASVGIGVALVKYVAEWKDDKKQLYQGTSSGFINTIILGALGGVLLYFLSGMIAGLFNMPELANLLKILALALPFLCLLGTVNGLLNGLREMKTWASLTVLRSVLMALFTITPVMLGFGVQGVVIGMAITALVICIVSVFFTRRHIRLDLRNYLFYTKKVLAFGGWALGGNMVSLLTQQLDVIMTGLFLAVAQVGYYSTAITISSFFGLLPRAIQRITYPATSAYWSQGKHEALAEMINKSMKYTTCLLLPLALGVGFFSREILILIFGAEFAQAAVPLCILLIARVITGGTSVNVAASLGAVGRPELNLIPNSLALVTNIGLSILLIPSYGIVGAAIAVMVKELVCTPVFFALVVRVLHIKIDYRWFLLAFSSCGIAIGLFIAGTQVLNSYIVGSSILVIFIIFVLMVLLKKEDKALFKSLIYSVLRR